MAVPGYVGPSRYTVSRRLKGLYKDYRNKLEQVFENVESISLTTDLWKNSNGTHFFCLTGHFIDDKFKQNSVVLSFRRIFGRHTSIRLERYIEYDLNILKIKEKISSITTDNCADIKKATLNKFGTRISCFAHNLHLTVTNGLNLFKEKKSSKNSTQKKDKNDINRDFNTITSETIESDLEDEENEDVEEEIIESAESDFEPDDESEIRNLEEENDINNDPKCVFKLIQKVRKMIKLIKRSSVIQYHFESCAITKNLKFGKLILDFHVRWNTTYLMLQRFNCYKEIVNEMTINPQIINGISSKQRKNLSECIFLENDWGHLSSLVAVLKPFYTATLLVSGQKYHTLYLAKYVTDSLKSFLENETENSFLSDLKTKLLVSFCQYFDFKISEELKETVKVSFKNLSFIVNF